MLPGATSYGLRRRRRKRRRTKCMVISSSWWGCPWELGEKRWRRRELKGIIFQWSYFKRKLNQRQRRRSALLICICVCLWWANYYWINGSCSISSCAAGVYGQLIIQLISQTRNGRHPNNRRWSMRTLPNTSCSFGCFAPCNWRRPKSHIVEHGIKETGTVVGLGRSTGPSGRVDSFIWFFLMSKLVSTSFTQWNAGIVVIVFPIMQVITLITGRYSGGGIIRSWLCMNGQGSIAQAHQHMRYITCQGGRTFFRTRTELRCDWGRGLMIWIHVVVGVRTTRSRGWGGNTWGHGSHTQTKTTACGKSYSWWLWWRIRNRAAQSFACVAVTHRQCAGFDMLPQDFNFLLANRCVSLRRRTRSNSGWRWRGLSTWEVPSAIWGGKKKSGTTCFSDKRAKPFVQHSDPSFVLFLGNSD